jgi:hypothetical protein
VAGKEKQSFAVHQAVISNSVVLDGMCRMIVKQNEDYRIELPEVDPRTLARILAWMYESSIGRALEHRGRGEGEYFGDIYIFAAKYGMEHFRYVVLKELEDRHGVRVLLDAAMTVYGILARETLFSLFFETHVIEKIISRSQRSDLAVGEEMNDWEVANMMAVGGDFGEDLTEALLRAMLVEKLSMNSMKHPLVVPPSQKNACAYFGDRPHVRNATGIALQD